MTTTQAPQPVTIAQPAEIKTEGPLPISQPVPHAAPVYVAPPELYCADCVNWRPLRNGAAFGQCLLSGRLSHSPLITTDRMSCSALRTS